MHLLFAIRRSCSSKLMNTLKHIHINAYSISIHKSIMFLLSAVSMCLGMFELNNHNVTTTIILVIFACYTSYLYYLLSYSKCPSGLITLLLITYTSLTLTSSMLRMTHYDVWLSFTPLIMYLLAGVKQGLIGTSLTLFFQVVIYLYNNVSGTILNSEFYMNLLIVFIVTWICIHLYEKHRTSVEDSLLSLATRDPLTGVKNRLSLANSFDRYKEQTHTYPRLHLLILDIDYFKQVNDTYGHDIGDKVLIDLSLLIRKIAGDDNVFRIGGEEFCITVFSDQFEYVISISEQLRQIISEHIFNFGTQRFQMTASIGICPYSDGDNLLELLKYADIELYKAKNNGRNQICICNANNLNESCLSEEYESS